MTKKQFAKLQTKCSDEIAGIKYLASGMYEEKKSKFYSYIFEITTESEANHIIMAVRNHFKDARHVVYAYVLDNKYYSSDDGEPSGTGGKAIYALLEKQKVVNTLVIVVRYFGGILLGVGPLSRAYTKAVKLAEEKLEIVDYVQKLTYKIECKYNEEPILRNLIEKASAKILNVEYGELITYNVEVNETEKQLFAGYKIAGK